MTQVYHQAKFRWTENLTCRFIQLRKENGKLFTGRKYSAQAGWEFILRQMRQEFPTIMADVHYRVLKKKWSNLLQQYKELKNPVHGDKNKADDVSWPFYGAIDEVLGGGRRESLDEDTVNPHEFLCVSVTPEEPASPSEDEPRFPSDEELERNDNPSILALRRLQALNEDCSIEIERVPRGTRPGRRIDTRKHSVNDNTLISRLPRATELSIKTVKTPATISVKDFSKLRGQGARATHPRGARNGNPSTGPSREELEVEVEEEYQERETKRPRRTRRPDHENSQPQQQQQQQVNDGGLERRLEEFLAYTKRRDEENRSVMLRILQAVEKIADKLK